MKTTVKYCGKCRKKTVHTIVARKTVADGLGIARAILAVTSFGISETVAADEYYQCNICGKIVKK